MTGRATGSGQGKEGSIEREPRTVSDVFGSEGQGTVRQLRAFLAAGWCPRIS
jgi:hypothetical protein